MRRAVLVAACCLAVLAAGCGGDDSSTETWADDFCGAIDVWRARVQDAAAELEARDEIEQELDHLESVLRERAGNARAGIDQPAGSVSEALARLAALSRELAAAAATIELTIEKLRALDPAGELKQALESSDACSNLRG